MTHTVALIKRFPPGDDKSHWVWILRYWSRDGSKRLSEAIGWYAPARDPWKPKWSKGPRLTESQVQEIQIQRRNDLREGRVGIPKLETKEELIVPVSIPFPKWKEKYIEETCGTVKNATLVTIKDALSALVKTVSPKTIEDVTHETVKKFIKKRLSEGVKGSTVLKQIAELRRVWYDAKIEPNPWANPKLRKQLKCTPKGWHWYQPDEFKHMLNACDTNREVVNKLKHDGCKWLLFKGMIALAYTGGLRIAEILNLTWDDISFENGEIEISPKRSTEKTLPWESKDHERRLAPLTQQTRLIFEEIRQVSDPENPYVFISAKRYNHLMIHKDQWRDDKALVNNLRRNFRSLCEKAEVPKDTFHSLRKSCCTNLLEGGVAPHAVQKIMGHSSLETTIRYYSKVRRDQISAAREVSQKYEAGLFRSNSHQTKTM